MSHQYKITSGTLKVGKNSLKAVQKPRIKVFDPVGKVVPALPANTAVYAAFMDVQLSVVEEDYVVGLGLAVSTSVNPSQKKTKLSPKMAAPLLQEIHISGPEFQVCPHHLNFTIRCLQELNSNKVLSVGVLLTMCNWEEENSDTGPLLGVVVSSDMV